MPKSLKWALSVAALVIAVVAGQATGTLASAFGNIVGHVTTPVVSTVTKGAIDQVPVANVNVAAVAPSGTCRAQTNASGDWACIGLAPDTYFITFSKSGFVTQTANGVTVTQDQTQVVNVQLQTTLRTLATIPVRGATSLVQPSETSDKYTITPSQIQNITGTPQNISETAVLNSLPGITTDTGGYPIIRAGAENDEGFQLEGIDATEPITGQFINSLSLAGVSRLVLSTGGYDVSNGNTNSGVVNEVIKRGAYPGAGQITMTSNFPNFDHRFAFEYGNGSPDNRFSYFYGFNGLRQFRTYGDQKTFLPFTVGAVGDASGNENVLNLFYRWGSDNRNELQYVGEEGANLFDFNHDVLQYGGGASAYCNTIGPPGNPGTTCLPYGSADAALFFGPTLAYSTTLFPTQVAYNQAINYPDHENNNHFIQKLQYKRQFSSNSYADVSVFRTNLYDHFLVPWNGGPFTDEYEFNESNNVGVNFDYQNQISNHHLIAFGGSTKYSSTHFSLALPTVELFVEPNEFGYIGYINMPHGVGGCGTMGATPSCTSFSFPLSTFVSNASNITDPVNTNDAWIEDTWTPNEHFNVKAGVRYDQMNLHLPANAQAQSTGLFFDPVSGNNYDVISPPITSSVTKPNQVSPRIALTYTPDAINSRNTFRASYGTNIEFTPLSNIENTYTANIPQAAYNCTIASGCFVPPAGYNAACVNGMAGGVQCNGVSSLAQQIIEDLNRNFFIQYSPVLPQRAYNADFSWEHDFTGGLTMRITPYYRKGNNYVVSTTPLLFTLPNGVGVFGAPTELNAGVNENTGIEWALDKVASYGWSGYIHGTYDNTLANYNSDFFPVINNAALQLNHFFHVSYLAPVTATMGVTYHDRHGLWVTTEFPYESGYRYGVGKKTFVFCGGPHAPSDPPGLGACGAPITASQYPLQVLNTDLAASALGLSTTSAYYFTSGGTILNPTISGDRGTNEGNDPGTLRSPQRLFIDLSVAHDLGNGPNHFQVGVRVLNLGGVFDPAVVSNNGLYQNCGFGVSCPNSGKNGLAPFLPLQFNLSPKPYEFESDGPARTFTFFVTTNL